MKPLLMAATCLGLFWNASLALAQTQGAVSLGELARQVRADRAKAGARAVKVFTNDDLSARRPAETQNAPAVQSETPEAPPAVKPETSAPATPESAEVHDEKYYRAEMARLRARLERHQRELEVLQQKLSQNQMQYYPDPNDTLQQEFTRGDVNKKLDEVEKKKQEVAADEKAIEDLRDQLRREGGYPGWLRE